MFNIIKNTIEMVISYLRGENNDVVKNEEKDN